MIKEGTAHGQSHCLYKSDPRWGHAGAGETGRGSSWRLRIWWLGRTLCRHGEAGERLTNVGALLLGRRTYEDFYDVWPKRKEDPISALLDNMQKYVASTTLSEPLEWINSMLLKGDATDAVARLKGEMDKDVMVMGSGVLIQSLRRHNLVDEYILLIHPLILGLVAISSPMAEVSRLSGSSAPGRRATAL